MDPLSILGIIVIAIVIDLLFGELPEKIHPVVFIGRIIIIFNNFRKKYSCINKRITGAFLTISLIIIVIFDFRVYYLGF